MYGMQGLYLIHTESSVESVVESLFIYITLQNVITNRKFLPREKKERKEKKKKKKEKNSGVRL